jgi:hypothetical protein
MNLERILAENMLRFGVKNLNESQLKNVSLLKELKDPAVEGQVRTAGKGTKDDPTRQLISYTCTFNQNGKTMSVVGTCKSLDGGKTWTPISVRCKMLNDVYAENVQQYNYDATTNTFTDNSITPITDWTKLKYSGPGNYPVNALNEVVSKMATKCGKSFKMTPTIVTNWTSMKNVYVAQGSEVTATGALKGTWFKMEPRNTETDAVDTTRKVYIQSKSIGDKIFTNAQGAIDKTSAMGSFSGFTQTLQVVANRGVLAASKGEAMPYSDAMTPWKYTGYIPQDKTDLLNALIASASNILASSTVAAPVAAPDEK